MRFKYIVAITFMLVSSGITSSIFGQQSTDLTVKQFDSAIQQPGIQVLDVRTGQEFKSGHLKDALLADWTNQTEFLYRVEGLDKSKPVYTYCLSGGRSGAAAKYLKDKGYTVYNMKGGIASWKQSGLPLEEPTAVKPMSMEAYNALISPTQIVLVDVGAAWCPPGRDVAHLYCLQK